MSKLLSKPTLGLSEKVFLRKEKISGRSKKEIHIFRLSGERENFPTRVANFYGAQTPRNICGRLFPEREFREISVGEFPGSRKEDFREKSFSETWNSLKFL